jgi:hypothetical protein
MSRCDSRTAPASARRDGLAVAGVRDGVAVAEVRDDVAVAEVRVSCACAVMVLHCPSRSNRSPGCPVCVHPLTRCDDCSALPPAGTARAASVSASSQLLSVTWVSGPGRAAPDGALAATAATMAETASRSGWPPWPSPSATAKTPAGRSSHSPPKRGRHSPDSSRRTAEPRPGRRRLRQGPLPGTACRFRRIPSGLAGPALDELETEPSLHAQVTVPCSPRSKACSLRIVCGSVRNWRATGPPRPMSRTGSRCPLPRSRRASTLIALP